MYSFPSLLCDPAFGGEKRMLAIAARAAKKRERKPRKAAAKRK